MNRDRAESEIAELKVSIKVVQAEIIEVKLKAAKIEEKLNKEMDVVKKVKLQFTVNKFCILNINLWIKYSGLSYRGYEISSREEKAT